MPTTEEKRRHCSEVLEENWEHLMQDGMEPEEVLNSYLYVIGTMMISVERSLEQIALVLTKASSR